MYYFFDNTYTGFLCCVFESFERKEPPVYPRIISDGITDIFSGSRTIISSEEKAKRVQRGLEKNLGKTVAMNFLRVFFSEDRSAWDAAIKIITDIFTGNPGILQNYGNSDVLYFAQTLKKVNREMHRMKAFVRFSKSIDGMYFATIEPDFNVLPLITDFFRNRYADQPWLIYDVKRKYGLFCDTKIVSEIQMAEEEKAALTVDMSITLDSKDEYFKTLWKQYFKSTNIAARKNIKLHLKHVPRRYWKYLVEKEK